MVESCPSRRRSTKRGNRHKAASCWRNPFIVFFLCFAVLGSLRFRVPARSKQAASNLLKRREQKRMKRATTELSVDVTAGLNTSSFSYSLIEKGKDAQGRSFLKYKALLSNEEPVSVEQWANTLAAASESDSSMELLNKAIEASPFRAVFFETPPVTAASSSLQPFEFVLVDAPQLHSMASENPNVSAFRASISKAEIVSEYGAVFPNLGGDAILIVPKPAAAVAAAAAVTAAAADKTCYAHLTSFVRGAPPGQVAAVWNMAARAYLDRIADGRQQPVWFSTSGMGIFWLHFRLDTVPKYYTYEPYKRVPVSQGALVARKF